MARLGMALVVLGFGAYLLVRRADPGVLANTFSALCALLALVGVVLVVADRLRLR